MSFCTSWISIRRLLYVMNFSKNVFLHVVNIYKTSFVRYEFFKRCLFARREYLKDVFCTLWIFQKMSFCTSWIFIRRLLYALDVPKAPYLYMLRKPCCSFKSIIFLFSTYGFTTNFLHRIPSFLVKVIKLWISLIWKHQKLNLLFLGLEVWEVCRWRKMYKTFLFNSYLL